MRDSTLGMPIRDRRSRSVSLKKEVGLYLTVRYGSVVGATRCIGVVIVALLSRWLFAIRCACRGEGNEARNMDTKRTAYVFNGGWRSAGTTWEPEGGGVGKCLLGRFC